MMNLGDAGTPCGCMDTRIARGNQIQISGLSDIFTVLPAFSSGKVMTFFCLSRLAKPACLLDQDFRFFPENRLKCLIRKSFTLRFIMVSSFLLFCFLKITDSIFLIIHSIVSVNISPTRCPFLYSIKICIVAKSKRGDVCLPIRQLVASVHKSV